MIRFMKALFSSPIFLVECLKHDTMTEQEMKKVIYKAFKEDDELERLFIQGASDFAFREVFRTINDKSKVIKILEERN